MSPEYPFGRETPVATPRTAGRILVIGSGPVGMRFVYSILHYAPSAEVLLFGNEPVQPYNRVQLSSLLAGKVTREAIDLPLPGADRHPNFSFRMVPIRLIHKEEQFVIDQRGQRHHYDVLVIATGARAHVPSIPGLACGGVYSFRSLLDAETLYARVVRSRHTVVVGGGLLGLEAAKGLLRHNTQVTLVQQGPRLMNRQLDEEAATRLRERVESLGIRVVVHSGVRAILGESRVRAVQIQSGEEIECDTVLLCAGVKPNTQLALMANLRVATGIVVDDRLQTSQPGIYAIGECCEHRGQTYGLVNPGFEQAAVAADVITGGQSFYRGSQTTSQLKVVGETVFSFGETVDLPDRPRQIVLRQRSETGYRRVTLLKGRIIGALGIGDWPELNRVREAFRTGRKIWPWQVVCFRHLGKFWPFQEAGDPQHWPASAIICQCNSVTQGRLMEVLNGGRTSLELLGSRTGAGNVCGGCKPLLARLLGTAEPVEKDPAWRFLIIGSLVASLLGIVILFLPEAPVSDSVRTQGWFEKIWNDKSWKQVTGFSLLGLILFSLSLSLRKRLGWRWMGNFASWRALHVLLGAACAAALVFHTGFHLGDNLNQLLMVNFLCVLLMGSLAGITTAQGHKMSAARALRARKTWTWLHLLVTWPLPALLASHIITVYYF